MDSPVVLFDGSCNLCAWWVRFIIGRERAARFRFASLQSPVGRELQARYRPPALRTDSVILIESGRAYVESDAALRIARSLAGFRPLACLAVCIPRPVRDAVYRFIARHRYQWFGKSQACFVPSPDVRTRFLDMQRPSHENVSGTFGATGP